MAHKTIMAVAMVATIFTLSAAGMASVVYIGGSGAISTDGTYGSQGLLSGGEVATAKLQYDLSTVGSNTYLTLTVTNTSPAVTGTDSPSVADAPVMSDVMFSAPSVVTNMQLLTFNGITASTTGWAFSFSPNGEPSKGFGFLKDNFDAWAAGGPPGNPAPVIGSIYDPDLSDGPGKPTYASPVTFYFKLTFSGASAPAGFTSDWFVNRDTLGNPTYIDAAKFMSGANGGSATVTDGSETPEPASLLLLVAGLAGLGMAYRRNSLVR